MAWIFRWLLRIFFAGLVLAGLAAALAFYLAARSLPDYDAAHSAEGLDAPLEIVRDNANVPHIFGATDADSYFGLGYVHAQDRLWQMLMFRRTAQGRLSELFGTRTVAVDRLLRRLDLYNIAVASVAAQDDYGRAALAAYARGVNARIARVNDAALGRGAPEFFLFPTAIAPWTPADSIAVGKLLSLQLATHLEREVQRARASLVLTPERLADLLPDDPSAGVAALPEFATLFPGVMPDFSAPASRVALAPAVPGIGLAGASNAWAAAPSRSAKQGSLLATDPHMGLSAPASFYLARLDLAAGPIIGGTIPGMPVVLMGRTDKIGWGLTTTYLDDQDILIEKLAPDDPSRYLTPEGFKPFIERQSIVQIKGAPPQTVTLRWSENGPVLPEGNWGLDKITPAGHVPVLAWTALSPDDGSMSAFLKIMQAADVEGAIAAGAGILAPAHNMIVADRTSIGMVVLGAMPRRSARHQSQGRIPAPGWLPENRWQGRLRYSANPRFIDPEGGIVGNTNNKIIDRPFPFHVSHSWGDSQRVQRWQGLMQGREVHTRESFIEAQLDTVSVTARTLLPLVGGDLFFTEAAAAPDSAQGRRKRALELLAAWNGEMNEHLPEPLIYAAWMRALQDRLLRDDLADVTDEFAHLQPLFIERVFRDIDNASAWCDVKQSAAVETCTETARAALDDALQWLGQRHGGSLESLRWGDAHETRADHPVLGGVPLLGWLVNVRQSTSGGDNTLMRGRTLARDPDPFVNVHAAVFRAVYDFADPESSVFIISTGQSGHPLSRYYDDLGALWRRGEYIPMTLDPALARAAAVGVTRLSPPGE